jgi:hypothetical protein
MHQRRITVEDKIKKYAALAKELFPKAEEGARMAFVGNIVSMELYEEGKKNGGTGAMVTVSAT